MNNKTTIINKVRHLSAGKQGFTLVETMIALTIITFAILGPISLATYSIKASTLSKNQVIASFLAQDAMEYIKNWRDNNDLSGGGWLDNLEGPCSAGCIVDTFYPYSSGNAITSCTGQCPPLKYDDISKIYNYTTGNDTIFTRGVVINKNPTGQEAEVSVTISWEDKFGTRTFVLEDHIFNWHP